MYPNWSESKCFIKANLGTESTGVLSVTKLGKMKIIWQQVQIDQFNLNNIEIISNVNDVTSSVG